MLGLSVHSKPIKQNCLKIKHITRSFQFHPVPMHFLQYNSEEKLVKRTNTHTLNLLSACGCFETFGLKFLLHKSRATAVSNGKGEVTIF